MTDVLSIGTIVWLAFCIMRPFFYKLSSPRWFYHMSGQWLVWLAVTAVLLLLIGIVWGVAFAPADFRQGNSFRIIYVHMPAAAVAMAGYVLMALAAVVSLVWRVKLAAMVIKSCAVVGAVMTLIALVTGALWGKPTWGTWWVWDARVTSVLILLFLYIGLLALYNAFDNKELSSKSCAVLCLVGLVNIPIIYWSVEWWYSLHQPTTIKFTQAPSMHATMFYPLLVTLVGFYVFYAWVVILYTRVEIIYRERHTQWVKTLSSSYPSS